YKMGTNEVEYEFIGWDKSLENITADTDFYAQFEEKKLYFTLTILDMEGNVVNTISNIKKGTKDIILAPIPAPVGYEFVGWDTDYSNIISDLEIRPICKEIEYSVSFDVNENMLKTSAATETIYLSKSEFINDFSTDFFNWLKDNVNNIDGLTFDGLTYTYIRNSKTATWTDISSLMSIDKYTVEKTVGNLIYQPMDRLLNQHAYDIENENYFLNSIEYRIKYQNMDDYLLNCIDTTYSSYSREYQPASGKVQIFFRFWQWMQGTTIAALDTLPITFSSDSAIDADEIIMPSNFTYTITKGATLANPSTSLTFLGWYNNKLGYGQKIEVVNIGETGDIVLYAMWDPELDTKIVTYVDADGNTIQKETVSLNTQSTPPAVPDKPGYLFVKWDKTDTGVTDITIQATYELVEYTIEYVDNMNGEKTEGMYYDSYNINDCFDLCQLKLDGYIFVGWYDNSDFNGTAIQQTTIGNLRLYAKWIDTNNIEESDMNLISHDNKIEVGRSTTIIAKDGSQYIDPKDVTFISDDMVTIDQDGYLIGKKVGNATILAVYNNMQATVEVEIVQNLDTLWVGHTGSRGAGIVQNTEAAFIEGAARGYYALETDVRVSSDGVYYLHHDDLFLTSSTVMPFVQSSLDEQGISAGSRQDVCSWETLSKLLVHKMGDDSVTSKLCTVDEYLKICKNNNTNALLELKWTTGINSNDQSNLGGLMELIKENGMLEHSIILSSMKNCILWVRNNYPNATIQYLSGSSTTTQSNLEWCIENKFSLDASYAQINNDVVKVMHDAGLYVNGYTVNSQVDADKIIDNDVDMITTDNLGGN
ncbi:MAG: InlB B-repeat-containing protein, partial [Bacilli bacterium]